MPNNLNLCFFNILIKNIYVHKFFLMGFIVVLYLLSSNLDKVISMYNLICLDPKKNYKKKWKEYE
jgi:hypothetical protein